MSRTRQTWVCPTCGYTYYAPIVIKEALCQNPHPRGKRAMKLVDSPKGEE